MEKSGTKAGEVAQGIQDLIAAINFQRRLTEAEAKSQGYYSAIDAAKAMGLSASTAQRKLKAAADAGLLERVTATLPVGGTGQFYRHTKKGAKK